MPSVLIADSLPPDAVEIFEQRGIIADSMAGLSPEELVSVIDRYEGLIVRSATKVSAELMQQATRLRVIGRAGVGIDNVDVCGATRQGVVVMNTPQGNAIAAAEHTLALLFALARNIPAADRSTQAGKWERGRFTGIEVTGKTLGIIGCGTIGSLVGERALGLHMDVLVYDPFISHEKAAQLGLKKVGFDILLAQSDFVTLHVPLTEKTHHLICSKVLAKMKRGARIINCARGGLIDEQALLKALDDGQIAGAACDVFSVEPARENMLFGHPHVICTPHLGASTREANANVATQIADQVANYLLHGVTVNAVNVPALSREEAYKLQPLMTLGAQLGALASQLMKDGIQHVHITYEGSAASVKTGPITTTIIAGLLSPLLHAVNSVSALLVAEERGIEIEETLRKMTTGHETLINIAVTTDHGTLSLSGTLLSNGKPRIVSIDTISMDSGFYPSMIYVVNEDKPGFIGHFASLLGDSGINIGSLTLGRDIPGGCARALVEIDGTISEVLLEAIKNLNGVREAKILHFEP
jgi:D-3-phosphoglycerate dehydrogenase